MINRGTSSGTPGGRGPRRNSGIPYLTTDKLTSEKQQAKILAARVQDDNFKKGQQVVVVKLLLRSNPYLYTVRMNNPNLDVLVDAFGEDEEQWAGKDILLFMDQDEFDGRSWVRVEVAHTEEPEVDEKPKRKR